MFPFYIWLFILCQKLHPDFSYEPGSNTTKQPNARKGASGMLLFPCLMDAFHKNAIKSPQNIIQKLPDTPRAKPLAAPKAQVPAFAGVCAFIGHRVLGQLSAAPL